MTLELNAASAAGYLVDRGLLPDQRGAKASELPGGVSSTTIVVETNELSVVVKHALPRLKVDDEWLADPRRSITEARALAVWNALLPGTAPRLLDTDEVNCTLVLEMAPSHWRSWRTELEAGRADILVAQGLGRCLARWHTSSSLQPSLMERFDDPGAFEEVRVDPYHRTVMKRLPAAASAISTYIDRMSANRRCLIHGDFSPKNVLVGDGRFWVLDFEVANRGDPAFDLAFMTHHLLLEAIRRPEHTKQLLVAARVFWDSYYGAVEAELAPDRRYAIGHTACLILARLDGKSRIAGLDQDQVSVARHLGLSLLADTPSDLMAVARRIGSPSS